jgi:tetratricopeptide (TPR) repeat protein
VSAVERARDAAARGELAKAYACFVEAEAEAPLAGEDLPLFAQIAYCAGEPIAAIDAWERAHAERARDGHAIGAAEAAMRVALHMLLDTGLMAPVRGWLARAEQFLAGQPETPVHAWLAVVHNYERMMAGDFAAARDWAARAIDIGARCNASSAATIGRIAQARSLIFEGDVRTGLSILDIAAVAVASDELDPLSKGMVYCELVCCLQALAQYDLAEQWTAAMDGWCARNGFGSLHGRCRVHRAEILRLRGELPHAEREALRACDELRPYLRRELGWPLGELGRIRLLRGDLAGAEEVLLEAHERCWDAQPQLALLRLAQGDVAQATELIRDALERPSMVPSKELPPNTELRRAPLLAALVQIELAAGNVDRARAAAGELDGIARRFESKALVATAADARGRVHLASGDAAAARNDLEAAARLWLEIGAPYETAVARATLADALAATGNAAAAELERRAAKATLDRLGTVGTAAAPSPAAAPAADVFRREGDYWAITFEGRTLRLRDLKGMRYLARLFEQPRREHHVLELVAIESGHTAVSAGELEDSLGDAGEVLDAQAKQAYRRRLAEIEADISEATVRGDVERVRRARAEHEFLQRELSRAVGLGNRDRRSGSASERARVSVTRALRQAITRIREHDRELAEHLDRALRTGTYCAYEPDHAAR